MKFWKKFTLGGGIVWGIKSMAIGFGGGELLHVFPQLHPLSFLSGLIFWTGMWGCCLVAVCGILYACGRTSGIEEKTK